MINKVTSYSATCDNCGEVFTTFHECWSLFVDENSCHEAMNDEDWFTGNGDPKHEGKHYCPGCFKHHPDEDDKIIVDETRRKQL